MRTTNPIILAAATVVLSVSCLAIAQENATNNGAMNIAPTTAPTTAMSAAENNKANPQKDGQTLPVRGVTLFSSGVGYFEHGGKVQENGSTELRFKTAQINDILKSLVLQDLDGGQVAAVQYPSQDPVNKTLKSFQIDLTGNPSLENLLVQLRGAKITIQIANERREGTILGVEKRTSAGSDDKPITSTFVNLFAGGSIRQIELGRITDLHVEDPILQDEITRALAAVAGARDTDKKSVNISFRGDGERRIKLGYVVESPIWKTSYRLVVGEKESDLQGWAIVENQTDNDWEDVNLSLVSGRPISFLMDLYQPLYLPRPTVELERYQSLRPQNYAAGMKNKEEQLEKMDLVDGDGKKSVSDREIMRRATRSAPQESTRDEIGSAASASDGSYEYRTMNATTSVRSAATAAELGELFQYDLGSVSLPRQKSAMIPIVTDQVGIEKYSIYNRSVLDKHPLNGAMLVNSTDKHLLQGPITVYEGGGYAGDATIDNMPPGQKRLLSYGIDLDITAQQKDDNNVLVQGGSIVKGVLIINQKIVNTTKYMFESKSKRDKTIMLEHPKIGSYELKEPEKAFETTDNLYRFKLPIAAGKGAELTVRQEWITAQSLAIVNSSVDVLVMYSRRDEIPKAVRDALVDVINRRQAAEQIARDLDSLRNQMNSITNEQGRIRENMKTVDRQSAYYNRMLGKLNTQEDQLEGLRKDEDSKRIELERLQKELADSMKKLTIE